MPQSASTHEDQEENIPLQTISTRKPQQLTVSRNYKLISHNRLSLNVPKCCIHCHFRNIRDQLFYMERVERCILVEYIFFKLQ